MLPKLLKLSIVVMIFSLGVLAHPTKPPKPSDVASGTNNDTVTDGGMNNVPVTEGGPNNDTVTEGGMNNGTVTDGGGTNNDTVTDDGTSNVPPETDSSGSNNDTVTDDGTNNVPPETDSSGSNNDTVTDDGTNNVPPEATGDTHKNTRWTFYNLTENPHVSCDDKLYTNEDKIVALSGKIMGGSRGPLCNQQIQLTYQGNTATATIKDTCPECPEFALDLSPSLFKDLVGPKFMEIGQVTTGTEWSFL